MAELDQLTEFAASLHGVRGMHKMLKACALAFDDSNSPMETILALMLSLPEGLGGYSLPKPQLNVAVVGYMGKRPQSFVRTGEPLYGVRYGDVVYPDQHLVVEYLSKAHHEGRWDADALRSNELADAGFDVISVTPAQVYAPYEMDKVAGQIARKLSAELPELSIAWRERNAGLREQLGLTS